MNAVDRAKDGWGDKLPEWVLALAKQCDTTNQGYVAKKMAYSSATISQLIRGKYPGDTEAVELAFKGAFMSALVKCPVVGELATDTCNNHQRAKWSPHNPQRIQFYRACRNGCPNSRIGGKADAQ